MGILMLQWDMQSRILCSRIFYLGLSGHGAETHFQGNLLINHEILGVPYSQTNLCGWMLMYSESTSFKSLDGFLYLFLISIPQIMQIYPNTV